MKVKLDRIVTVYQFLATKVLIRNIKKLQRLLEVYSNCDLENNSIKYPRNWKFCRRNFELNDTHKGKLYSVKIKSWLLLIFFMFLHNPLKFHNSIELSIVSIRDNKNISTEIGKSFLSLLGLQFPKNHIYNSIFSRNKIKVSYSCMQNINRL